MTYRCFTILGSLAISAFLTSSACNIHDNTINIPNATINATTDVDVSNVMPGQDVSVTATVQNVFLVEPTATPPAEHAADASHFQVYLDDTNGTPLLVTAQTTFTVTIPPETKEGNRKLICRVHKHDGAPTSTKFEISITVKVTGTTTDANVTVEVDANTSTGADANPQDASAAEGG
jgi:hypothetical protein